MHKKNGTRGMREMIPTISYLYFALLLSSLVDVCRQEHVRIDTTRVHRQLNEHFVGVAIDTNQFRHYWTQLNSALKSTNLKTLALALSPSIVRVGGTSSDFLIFDDGSLYKEAAKHYPVLDKLLYTPSVTEADKLTFAPEPADGRQADTFDWYGGDLSFPEGINKDLKNFTMTGDMIDSVYKFVESVGWNMTFDLNVLLRTNGKWDPTNAVKLIDYVANKGYKLAGWELGNEPNAFYHLIKLRVAPEQLAQDYAQMKKIVRSYQLYEDCIILGPSVTQLDKHSTVKYLDSFLKSGGADTVTAASFHQYYLSNKSATIEDFTDPDMFNILIQEVATGVKLIRDSGSSAKLWIGETSCAVGALHEKASLTYRAGFLWLDKLGVTASGGVDVLIRQSFYGGMNSLIDRSTLKPRPDYWLTLLYKLLVGNKVLQVLSPSNTGRVRVYAHCTSTSRSGYNSGSVIIYAMNLHDTDRNLTFPDFNTQEPVHLYSMEPNHGSLDSRTVLLNGKRLKMVDDSTLPNLLRPVKTRAPITIKALTYSFIVFPDVHLKVCLP